MLLEQLAAQARRGDVVAWMQFCEELSPQMSQIVRCVLHRRVGKTPLDRHILAEARRFRLELEDSSLEDQESVVREVADRVFQTVIANLKPSTDPITTKDTVPIAAYATTLVMS